MTGERLISRPTRTQTSSRAAGRAEEERMSVTFPVALKESWAKGEGARGREVTGGGVNGEVGEECV